MKKIFLPTIIVLATLFSCDKDEDKPTPIPPRDAKEVAFENDIALREYLKHHFYNTATSTTGFDGVVGLDTIAGKNANNISLWDNPNLKKKKYYIKDIKGQEVEHIFYYLILKEGKGKQATVADSSLVNYRGQLLNGRIFDESKNISLKNYIDLLGDLTDSNRGFTTGFRESVALLKESDNIPNVNNNGTFQNFNNYGKGIFFIPSGMAYFNGGPRIIPQYSPLIFTINLYKTKNADHDKDGIPSINEIKIDKQKGNISFPDCNNNRIPDYLDPIKCN